MRMTLAAHRTATLRLLNSHHLEILTLQGRWSKPPDLPLLAKLIDRMPKTPCLLLIPAGKLWVLHLVLDLDYPELAQLHLSFQMLSL